MRMLQSLKLNVLLVPVVAILCGVLMVLLSWLEARQAVVKNETARSASAVLAGQMALLSERGPSSLVNELIMAGPWRGIEFVVLNDDHLLTRPVSTGIAVLPGDEPPPELLAGSGRAWAWCVGADAIAVAPVFLRPGPAHRSCRRPLA